MKLLQIEESVRINVNQQSLQLPTFLPALSRANGHSTGKSLSIFETRSHPAQAGLKLTIPEENLQLRILHPVPAPRGLGILRHWGPTSNKVDKVSEESQSLQPSLLTPGLRS